MGSMNSTVPGSDNFRKIFSDQAAEENALPHGDFVATYLDKLQPVVIRGGINHWPAIGKWTPDYLRKVVGEQIVSIGTISPDRVKASTMRAADLIDTLANHPVASEKTPYLTKLNIHDKFPSLSDDVKPHPHEALPDRLSNRLLMNNLHYPKGQMELLFGGGGLGFPLHFDRGFMHAFIMQVYGEKEAVLIAPEQGESLYRSSDFDAVSSIQNIWEPDFERYPRLSNVSGCYVRLFPGDLIFVPSGWWHATRLPGLSIGTTCNSFSRSNWSRYKKFLIDQRRGKSSAVKLLAWRAYIEAVGASCRLHEIAFGR